MNEMIRQLMQANPQQWTIESILSTNFGRIIAHDQATACLQLSQFYYIEGLFNSNFAKSILNNLHPSAIIVSSEEAWYEFFLQCPEVNFQKIARQIYQWNNQVNKVHEHCTRDTPYEIKPIGLVEAKQIEILNWANGVFDSYQGVIGFVKNGFGYCVLDKNKIISICLSFAHSRYGVEIEVDTDPMYQGQGLAKLTSAHFIVEALRRGLTPLWDASNAASAKIAENLGFTFAREYIAITCDD